MASNIIGHPATPIVAVGVLAAGVACILTGAFAGKSVAMIAGFCGTGSILTLAGLLGIAIKIDHYYRKKRINSEPEIPYTAAYIFNNFCDDNDEQSCLVRSEQEKLDSDLREKNCGVNIRYGATENIRVAEHRLDFQEHRLNRGIGDDDL